VFGGNVDDFEDIEDQESDLWVIFKFSRDVYVAKCKGCNYETEEGGTYAVRQELTDHLIGVEWHEKEESDVQG
jgi:hypothetical protein